MNTGNFKQPTNQMRQSRRSFIALSTSLALLPALPTFAGSQNSLVTRPIPSSGQMIPSIGMGSWLTFDVDPGGSEFRTRVKILKAFFDAGGQVIDSSPMYGRSEGVIGECLKALDFPPSTFSATKVWTSGELAGVQQMQTSQNLWKLENFSLMQIHNLVDWKTHIRTLLEWKAKGRIRYLGVTTYGGLRHSDVKEIMQHYPIDFVQLTYNILDREAEHTLLPLAKKNNIAVLANRPFQEGRLFKHVAGKPFPENLQEYGCSNWPQFFLKFIQANPAVTCAIPATSQLEHMKENMGALSGLVPSLKQQNEMATIFRSLIDG